MRHSRVLLLLSLLGFQCVRAGTLALGILSYDPQQSGVNVFNIEDLTGAAALPSDFPVTTALVFQNLSLTILTDATSQQIALPDVGPGALSPPPSLFFSSSLNILSATLQATLNTTSLNVASQGSINASSSDLLFVLSPSAGSTLQPGIDLGVLSVVTTEAVVVPEPSTWMLAIAGIALIALSSGRLHGTSSVRPVAGMNGVPPGETKVSCRLKPTPRLPALYLFAIAGIASAQSPGGGAAVLQFSGPGCSECVRVEQTLAGMQAEFGDRLQIVTRQLPADAREAAALGVRTLPTLFVNGKRLAGPVDEAMLRKAIDTATGRTLASQPTVLDVRTAATLGPAGGPEITVFSDFQCPYCGMLAPVLSQLAASGEARIRFKHFPLSFHIKAALAHKAAVAAGDQGKFWEMHDRIFAGQARLDRATFESYAADLKLDMAKFRAALDAKSEPTPVTEDLREGERIAVAGTPTIFINSRLYLGRPDLASIRAALKSIAPETQAPLPQLLTLYGPADAPLRLEWFFDAQSELTRDAAQELRRLMASRPAGLQIVARHRPLEFHPQAPMLHEALVAAESQGRFWELLEVIQRDPASATADRLPALALRAGLDERRFSDELSRRAGKAAVERDVADARTRGIRGTPAYYLNKKALTAIPTARELADAIRAESLQAQALIKETSR